MYWNDATGLLTNTATGNRRVGIVTVAKDGNNVIQMKLGAQLRRAV